MSDWHESARDLLTDPEPAGQDWLIQGLFADQCRGVIQAKHKVGKTWAVLESAIAIVTGRPAFGAFTVPESGPVLLVLEESPRRRTRQRLDMLVRGRAQSPEDVADLHVASNRGVSLAPGSEWRERILEQAVALNVRAVFLDPLARVKGAELDENAQIEIALVLDFLSQVAREAECGVIFSHHEPHDHARLRGSSDLEAWWSSKVLLSGATNPKRLEAQHRDEEPTPQFTWSIDPDDATGTVRLGAEAALGTAPRRDELMERALHLLEVSGRWMGQAKIGRELNLSDPKDSTLRRALKALVDDGRIEREPDGDLRYRGGCQPPRDTPDTPPAAGVGVTGGDPYVVGAPGDTPGANGHDPDVPPGAYSFADDPQTGASVLPEQFDDIPDAGEAES